VRVSQAHDVETVIYIRHFTNRTLVDAFPRYFLPHQRLPVLDVTKTLDVPGAELLLQHFVRDKHRGGVVLQRRPDALRLCTLPTRPVLQYGLCQHMVAPRGAPDDGFMLEEVPPVVPRPVHPAWGAGVPRNAAVHRQAFWALALLVLAEDRSARGISLVRTEMGESAALQRTVHCAMARLRFDIATLPPGALCGDPPRETSLEEDPSAPASMPSRDYGLLVNWERLTASPFFPFNPSRAHGPPPRVAVALDATPTIDREHVFTPHPDLTANASLLLAVLESCTSKTAASSAWLQDSIAAVLRDFDAVPLRVSTAGGANSALYVPSDAVPKLVRSDTTRPAINLAPVLPPATLAPTVAAPADYIMLGNKDEAAWSDDCTHIMQLGSMSLESCKEGCVADAQCNAVRVLSPGGR
jgi:hypothetical protein